MIFSKIQNDFSKCLRKTTQLMCNLFAKSKSKQCILNLDPKRITDNKKFWKSVKPLFSNKITVKEIINLTVNREILNTDTDIAEAFNDYFTNIVPNFNISRESSLNNTDLCINPVLAALEKYKHHQSIISINEIMRKKDQPNFSFHFVTLEETIKEVALLSGKKISQASDIPAKIIKENQDLVICFI